MKTSKVYITLISILLIYTIIGFIAIPKIAKPQIEKIINENITQTATIEKIEFNPFLLKFSAYNFKIMDKDITTFSLDKVSLDFSVLKSLDEKHINFKNLSLVNPYINIIENSDGTFNLEKIAKPSTPTKEEEKKVEEDTSSIIKFQIFRTVIENAKIDFTKIIPNKEPYKLTIHNFNYTFYDMGTFRNSLASHTLSLMINQNTSLSIKGGLRLSPFEMYGNVEIKDLKPKEFLDYDKSMLNFDLNNNAFVNLKFGYQVDMKKDLKVELDKGVFEVNNVDIKQNDNSIFALNKLQIDNINLKYPQNIVSVDTISLDKLSAKITKDKNEIINLTTLVKEQNSTKNETKDEAASKPWNVTLKNINLKNSAISYNDLKTKQKVESSNIAFDINDFNLDGSKITLKDAAINNIDVKFDDKTNRIYVEDKKQKLNLQNLLFDNSLITLDSLSLNNSAVIFKDFKNSMQLFTKPIKISFDKIKKENEDISINRLNVNSNSIVFNDNKNQIKAVTNLLKIDLDNLSLKDMNIALQKIGVKTSSIKIDDKKSKTNIDSKNINLAVNKIEYTNNSLKVKNALLNRPTLAIVLGKQEAKEKTQESKKEETKKVVKKEKSNFSFDIGPVDIKNMKMSFQDKNLPIPFVSNITELNGNFSRLNSQSSKPTKLKLEGKVDEYGYTKITGTVDINDIKLLTDTNLLFKNIAIKNFTPYSGKFVGREIDEGKLNLDLKYNIKSSDLNAQNSIIISDIKLGKNVESKDAINLPLELAIALLEDSSGVIDIDLPIAGNVDDPQFSVAPIVWKAFVNLIVKAVASPFSLLASLFGIDEDKLKAIEFQYGDSNIIASEKESLDAISKILKSKPKLAIKIEPSFDPIKDKVAIQESKFEKIIDKEMKNFSNGDKYKKALEKLYKKEKDVKALDEVEKSFIIKDKDGKEVFNNEAYVEYLKNTLASKQEVKKEEILTLVDNRIKNIKEYLKAKEVDENSLKIEDTKEQTDSKEKWIKFKLAVATK